MPVWSIVLLIVIAVLIAALVALTIVGRKLQKKQEANNAQLEAAKQVMSMLVIDKKMMKLKDAGLPKMVLDQTLSEVVRCQSLRQRLDQELCHLCVILRYMTRFQSRQKSRQK